MLDTSTAESIAALRELWQHWMRNHSTFVLWIGAGASRWGGYPSWQELADRFHSEYSRVLPAYDKDRGKARIHAGLQHHFQYCKDLSKDLYFDVLSREMTPRSPSALYLRFAAAVTALPSRRIITTNYDLLLEQHVAGLNVVHHEDVARLLPLARQGENYLLKMHGSVQDLQSVVLATEDYTQLEEDAALIRNLDRLLAGCTILFVGCGVKEAYLLKLFRERVSDASPFRSGPHFAILPKDVDLELSAIRPIRYHPKPHADHRASISVLEELAMVKGSDVYSLQLQSRRPVEPNLRSAHLLHHFVPPGTWRTSTTLTLQGTSGNAAECVIGEGLRDTELVTSESSALTDIIIGLLCFDEVIAPLPRITHLHNYLGSNDFWKLVGGGCLTFVHWEAMEGMFYEARTNVAGGELVSFEAKNADMTIKSVRQLITTELKPSPGLEKEADKLFRFAEQNTRSIRMQDEGSIPALTRGLLMRPTIRRFLGISEGMPLSSIPRWALFPVLRLTNVVKIGAACRILRVCSVRLNHGSDKLASHAFAAVRGGHWATDAASYVIAGQYGRNLESALRSIPNLIDRVVAFRSTTAGERLRREILQALAACSGSDVAVAINTSLREAISPEVLEKARSAFTSLYTMNETGNLKLPALWNLPQLADAALSKWRQRSKEILRAECDKVAATRNSLCPCTSGEKLKDCCLQAL